MKKIIVAIIGTVWCLVGFGVVETKEAYSIAETQETAIRERCDTIHDELKVLQRSDSRSRVYLGRYYETILTKFITPLNVRLVENSLSSAELIDNQNDFSKIRTNFVIDYVEYQKELEELVTVDCKAEPGRFYEKLVDVRAKRAMVEDDTVKLRSLAGRHIELVRGLKVGS